MMLVATCFIGMFAFAFLIAGFVALLSQDQDEIDQFQRGLHQIPKRGLRGAIERYFYMRREALPLSQVVLHWKTRREVRIIISIGVGFAIIAFITGHFTTFPK